MLASIRLATPASFAVEHAEEVSVWCPGHTETFGSVTGITDHDGRG